MPPGTSPPNARPAIFGALARANSGDCADSANGLDACCRNDVDLWVVGFLGLTGFIQAVYFLLLSKAYEAGDISLVYPIARGVGVSGAVCLDFTVWRRAIFPRHLRWPCHLRRHDSSWFEAHRVEKRQAPPLRDRYRLCPGSRSNHGQIGGIPHRSPALYLLYVSGREPACGSTADQSASPGDPSSLAQQKSLILVVGSGSMGGSLMVLYAFRHGPAPYVAALRESSVLLGALLGLSCFKGNFRASSQSRYAFDPRWSHSDPTCIGLSMSQNINWSIFFSTFGTIFLCLRAQPHPPHARLVRREPHDRGDDRHDAARDDADDRQDDPQRLVRARALERLIRVAARVDRRPDARARTARSRTARSA